MHSGDVSDVNKLVFLTIRGTKKYVIAEKITDNELTFVQVNFFHLHELYFKTKLIEIHKKFHTPFSIHCKIQLIIISIKVRMVPVCIC